MKIKVLTTYAGRLTGNQPIVAGEYPSDDPLLFGLTEYLITHGHAVITEHDPPATDEPSSKPKRGR